jgi:ribonuclease Z
VKSSVQPRLINSPWADPGLFIAFPYERRAILFDLGDLANLTARDLLKVTHVFVTHAHMDHFTGFDQLLRVFLGREKEIEFFGPQEFFERVEGKLTGYSWNLVEEYQYQLKLRVTEVHADKMMRRRYKCRDRFHAESGAELQSFSGLLVKEPFFRVEAAVLDHRIPCLGLSFLESFSVNVIKERLSELGLPIGPWLNRFKKALYSGENPESAFGVTWEEGGKIVREKDFALGELAKSIATISPGRKISYITDIVGSDENLEKAVVLAMEADHLFIEAAFLEKDRETAKRKYHLTAREAGLVARRAGVKQFTLLHFSPRYNGQEEEILKEAMEEYQS